MNTSFNTILFISGTFISNNCWDEWILFFEAEGYKCMAPAWPYKDAPAEELRNRPAQDAIAFNTFTSVTDHYSAIIASLPKKPILIGHSLGGLVVQLLLQRNLGVAGVALHSFPPGSITRFRFSFLKALWGTMMLFTSDRETYLISFGKWKYAITNGLAYEQQKELYYQYAIPESKTIVRDTFKRSTKIDFQKEHPPLLLTSGGKDKLIPASLNYTNYKSYRHTHSTTDYKEFNENNHLVFGSSGWRKEADFILYWLQGINN